MALDGRLASVQLLALAALRLRERQAALADPYEVVWLDGLPGAPPPAKVSPSGIYLPRKCATVEEWYESVACFREAAP